jgi:hypothetical protein
LEKGSARKRTPKGLNLKLPGKLKHYDGRERPDTCIDDYFNAINFVGGTPNMSSHMLQLYLVGPARTWLSNLPENSIFCWFDLKIAFETHFKGTYKRASTAVTCRRVYKRSRKLPENIFLGG